MTDLHKRLEEAAEKAMPEVIRINPAFIPSYHTGFERCGEWMFKEAIAMAKDWLKENAHDYSFSNEGCDALLADFERNMNKLWEDEK